MSEISYAGCADAGSVAFGNPIPTYTSLLTVNKTPTEDEAKAALSSDFGKALGYCRKVLNYYECKANTTNYALLWTSIVGAVAGGVIVPALAASKSVSASAIAAFGGLSGTANALQASLESNGNNPVTAIATRAKITESISKYTEPFMTEKAAANLSGIIIKTYSSCVANDIVTIGTDSN